MMRVCPDLKLLSVSVSQFGGLSQRGGLNILVMEGIGAEVGLSKQELIEDVLMPELENAMGRSLSKADIKSDNII